MIGKGPTKRMKSRGLVIPDIHSPVLGIVNNSESVAFLAILANLVIAADVAFLAT